MSFHTNRELIEQLAERFCARIEFLAQMAPDCSTWTNAVHRTLREYAREKGWKIIPEEKSNAGEYLCDFMIFDDPYGCRIACESQWNHGSSHQAALDWAFDKLRGVKGDLKLFIFEGTDAEWEKVIARYLNGYAQLFSGETYLALRWYKDKFTKWFWSAPESGHQPNPIVFGCLGQTDTAQEPQVLEKYGNNAAVRCPRCNYVYLVSGLINKSAGRTCPACSGSLATFSQDKIVKVRLV